MTAKKQTASESKEAVRKKTVSVYVPSDGTGAFLEGALNGVSFRIPTDTVVEIPENVAKVIEESRKTVKESARAVESFAKNGGRRIGGVR
ncbi:MAG: hypothetical protein II117_01820 [Clostridia bacterium]|nr:hypothetical protein [Clostridia bacterium]